ncbi:MAG: M14 family metallopeptidase [Candidatus Thermoplasmatota archaeon]|nr:M14 family metallopeptidase [Candidatus Thermoplasmatota archaeon]
MGAIDTGSGAIRFGIGMFLVLVISFPFLSASDTAKAPGPSEFASPSSFESNYTSYMDFPAMESYLVSLTERYPDISRLISLGETHEGRDIWCVKVSDNVMQDDDGGAEYEPDILLVGAHHGNEWISYEVPLYVLAYLLENYYGDDCNASKAKNIVDHHELFIVPMLNPDGTQYSHDTGDMWRKNREPNYISEFMPFDAPTPKLVAQSYGVDLNRNYGWMWHLAGGSNALNHRGGSYRGPPDNRDDDGDARIPVNWRPGHYPLGPEDGVDEDPWDGIDNDGDGLIDEDPAGGFSSLETIAMKNLGDTREFPVLITYHSYSELVLWPWGWTDEPAPDAPLMSQLGGRLADLNGYMPMQGYDLYMTTGEMTDWFYAMYGTLGYTFEVGRTFRPAEDLIIEECRKNLEATLFLCRAGSNPYMSYVRFDDNSSSLSVSGSRFKFDLSYMDEGYPYGWDGNGCELRYMLPDGRWDSSPLIENDDGTWSASVDIRRIGGDAPFYYRMLDVEGGEVTYPVYAPEMHLSLGSTGSDAWGLQFGLGTLMVMIFTLGTIWGGFGGGIFKSMRAERKG